MEYFAGLFDAEGYVSLVKDGRFYVGAEMANEEIPNLFRNTFGGNIYTRQRDKRKRTWQWVIATNAQVFLNFINLIEPYCIVKKDQLLTIKYYIEQGRSFRKEIRNDISHQLSCLKKPLNVAKDYVDVCTDKIPDETFWKWLAGFFDNDGNFCIYEYKGKNSIIFDSWIGVFNTVPNVISYVQQRITGSITMSKGSKFPIWKWICCQKDSKFVCESVYPYLKIKKDQCRLVMNFLEIKKTKTRSTSYSFDQINEIREIIKQIKHLNSL
jgi:hypothetical protein